MWTYLVLTKNEYDVIKNEKSNVEIFWNYKLQQRTTNTKPSLQQNVEIGNIVSTLKCSLKSTYIEGEQSIFYVHIKILMFVQ